MDFAFILTFVFLLVFLALALLLIQALHTPKEKYDPNHLAFPPQSGATPSFWKKTLFKMLVMRPWPYKDLWNPLNRLYWPDEQSNKRARRHVRKRRNS